MTDSILTNCPRCQAPLQRGSQICAVCGLPLDEQSIQAFYNWQRQSQAPATAASTAQAQVIYEYRQGDFAFVVYGDRLEVSGYRVGRGPTQNLTIPARTITKVSISGWKALLYISTIDRSIREFNVGLNAHEARQAVLSIVPMRGASLQ